MRVVARSGTWLQVESLLSGDAPNYCGDPRSELSRYRIRVFVPRRDVKAAVPLPKATCTSRLGEKPDMQLVWPNGRPAGGAHHKDAMLTDLRNNLSCFALTIADAKASRNNSFTVCVRARDLAKRNLDQLSVGRRGSGLGGGSRLGGGSGVGGGFGHAGPAIPNVIASRASAPLLRFLPRTVDRKKALSRRVVDNFIVHAAYPVPRGDTLNINITFVRDLSQAKLHVAHSALTKRRYDGRGGYKVGTVLSGHRAALRVHAGSTHQPSADLELLLANKVLVSVSIKVADAKLLHRYAAQLDIAGLARFAAAAP